MSVMPPPPSAERAVELPPRRVVHLAPGTVFWHGGAAGRRPGDLLLPPDRSSATNTTADHAPEEAGTTGRARRDRVYLTTAHDWATLYACSHGKNGRIYEVEPIGDLEVDPDYEGPGLASFQVTEARVITVAVPTRAQHLRARKIMRKVALGRRREERLLKAKGGG